MISGNNGVLTKATDAKKANEQATEYERVGLAAQSALIDGEGTINLADATGTAKGSLKKALIEEFGSESPVVAGYTAGKVTIGDKKYSVSTTGLLTEIKWTWTDNQASGEGHGKISVGDLITSKKKTTEQFYVIGIDGDTVSMLAKYNLKSDGSEQDTGANNACVFSSTNYWSSYSGSYPLNLNDYEIPSTATSIVTTAVDYGESLDVETGRLMKVEEVVALGGSMSDSSTSGCTTNGYTFINTQNYWLGSAGSGIGVWGVDGEGGLLDDDDVWR